MTDEEYVRAHWGPGITAGADIWGYGITLPAKTPRFLIGFVSKKPAWAAAAEFTRERLEQVRQLEADIEWVRGMSDTPGDVLMMALLNVSRPDVALVWTRELCASVRTLARLESALSDLKRGMK